MLDDQLVDAIRNFINPDVRDALVNCRAYDLLDPQDRISVPLRADVKVAYDKGAAAFTVTGRVWHYKKDEYLHHEQVFATKPLASHHDAAAYIEYVFDRAKDRMLKQLAQDALQEIIGKGKDNGTAAA